MPKSLNVAVDRIVRHIVSHTRKLVFSRRFLRAGAFNNSAERGKADVLISQLRSSASPPRFPPRYLVLSLVPFLLVTAYLLLPTFLQSISALPWIEAPHVKAHGTQTAGHEHPAPTTQIIYAPTTVLPQTGRAELVLNNNSPDEMVVTPTLYSKDGHPNLCDQITLKPAEVRRVQVADLAKTGLQGLRNGGGISLSYFGGVLVVGAQITLFGEGRAGSVDIPFSAAGDYKSTIQEAVWWSPDGAIATLVFGNASDTPIQIKMVFGSGEVEQIHVGSFATETFIYTSRNTKSDGDADSVRLEAAGPVGSLRAAGFVHSANKDFTSTIRFYDPEKVRQPNLYATNLKVEKSTPHLVLKNISGSTITATPKFFSLEGAKANVIELPPVELSAREAREVDLAPLIASELGPGEFRRVSVEVTNDGPAGSLIGALCSRDRASLITYDAPLRDSGPVRTSTGSYPWRVDGDYSTLVTITNISQKPAMFAALISYEGGQYIIDTQTVEARSTALFDLNQLQREQIGDRDGQTIPRSVTEGQFVWSVVGGVKEEKLVGRMQIVSVANRVSMNYSCELCCPWSFWEARILPSPVNILVAEVESLDAQQRLYSDCNGNFWITPWFNVTETDFLEGEWHSTDEAIATVFPSNSIFAVVEGVGGGSTSVIVSWQATTWFFSGSIDDCDFFYVPAVASSNVQVTPITMTVNEVGFTGDHQITKWVGGAVIDNPDGSSPTWKSSGNPDHPAAYTKGAKPTMFLKLGVSPSAPSTSAKIRVFMDSTIIAMKDITISGTTVTVTGLTTTVALENNVCDIAPMFDWDISFDGGANWDHIADTGPHRLFFTWATPLSPPFKNDAGMQFSPLYDKALEEATGYAFVQQAIGLNAVISAINQGVDGDVFYKPSVSIGFDHPLKAYATSGCQCSDLANLLRGLLRSIGIDGTTLYIWAGPSASTLLAYTVGSTGSTISSFRIIRALHDDAPANPHFRFHAVVSTNGTWYDPSYGLSYSSLPFDETANNSTPQQVMPTPWSSSSLSPGFVCPH